LKSRSTASGLRAASALGALLGIALLLPLAACEAKRPAPDAPAAAAKPAKAERKAGGRRGAKGGDSIVALGLRVKLELLSKLGADSLRIDVEAQGGSVVLAGEVKKRATSELASEVARQVEGVTAVDNRIEVKGEGGDTVDEALAEAEKELADAALETRVRLALVDRLGRDGFRIGTDAASGVVTLEFPKGLEKPRRREAMKTARRVDGVTKVVALDKE
jgi:osmotically-inducible protein OsmY